jgi:hypothetical protein
VYVCGRSLVPAPATGIIAFINISSFMGVTSYTNVCSKNVLEGEINDFILNRIAFRFTIYYLSFLHHY